MICSDKRCLICTPWERAEAGYYVTVQDVWNAIDRGIERGWR